MNAGKIKFKECEFVNTQTVINELIECYTPADVKFYRCTMTLFKTYLYWNSTGTGRVFDSVLVDDGSMINGTPNKEVKRLYGTGTPESAVTAPVGSEFLRSDGGASTTYYVKQSGTGNTGWIGK